MTAQRKAPRSGRTTEAQEITSPPPGNIYSTGRYAWRIAKGLATLGDHVRKYRAVRVPRGNYRSPLNCDYIPGFEGRSS